MPFPIIQFPLRNCKLYLLFGVALVWCRESVTSLIPNFFGQSHRKHIYNVWLLIYAGKNLRRALKTVKRQDALPFLRPTVPGLVGWSSAISRPQNCSTCLPTSGTSTSKRGLKRHEWRNAGTFLFIQVNYTPLNQILLCFLSAFYLPQNCSWELPTKCDCTRFKEFLHFPNEVF